MHIILYICTHVVHIIGESEYDHDDEEEEEFIREGIENALRAKERLEKAEYLEVRVCIHHVPIIISFAEAEKRQSCRMHF